MVGTILCLATILPVVGMSTYFLFPITPRLLVVLDEIRVVVDVETDAVVEKSLEGKNIHRPFTVKGLLLDKVSWLSMLLSLGDVNSLDVRFAQPQLKI